jgi:hypothetical protein
MTKVQVHKKKKKGKCKKVQSSHYKVGLQKTMLAYLGT